MASLSSFTLSSSERSSVKVRGFSFQFGMVLENWLRGLVILLKIVFCKTKNVGLAG